MTEPMTSADVEGALTDCEAIKQGHFVLTSGRHSGTYVQCARILEDPQLTTKLAQAIVSNLPAEVEVDVVVAPAVGGIIIGFAVAQALGTRFIFAERESGAMRLRRSFELRKGERALVVEDVVTTGGSVKEVADLVRAQGADMVGVVSLIDRGGDKAFDDEYWPLLSLEVESWDTASCPLCASDMNVDSPGSRRLG